jgi:hypothetical protein
MFEYIIRGEKPYILIVTPLGPESVISKETKNSIKRNDIPFLWVSYKSDNNCAANAQLGINRFYEENKFLPPYFFLLDDGVICGRHMFDRMVEKIQRSDKNIAYCYCNFEFKGYINKKFPADPFDPNRLIRSNYISSNSLIKTHKLEQIGWLVTDSRYERLLDWCTWLKFLLHGFGGIPCENASFVDISKEKSVSSREIDDYTKKYRLVVNDFVRPIIEKAREESEKLVKQDDIIKVI